METDGLFEQAMTGDKTAYEKWSLLHHETVARFGYQNGITVAGLQNYQLAVFRHFYRQLPNAFLEEQQATTALYIIASSQLPLHKSEEQTADDFQILRFEEDREIHQLMQAMDANERMPFVLFYFHKKSAEELDVLLEFPAETANRLIEQAIFFMRKKLHMESRENVEQRLQFLEASYNRFTPPFNEAELFADRETEVSMEIKIREHKLPVKKRTVAIIGISFLFLLGVIGASFSMNEDNAETTAAEAGTGEVNSQTVKAWKAEYKNIKASSPEKLGIDPSVYEKMEYVRRADEKFDRAMRKNNIKKFEDDPMALREQVEKIMLDIETPKGMHDALNQGELTISDTTAFLQSFALKTKELMVLADAVLLEHQDALSDAFEHGEFSAESIRAHKEQYPKEVAELMGSLSESMLSVTPHPTEKRFFAKRNMELFYGNDLIMQDTYGFQFVSMLVNEPYYDNEGLLVPLEVMPLHLMQMEQYLVDPAQNPNHSDDDFETIFGHAFWLLLKGSEANPVFEGNGVVKKEYQAAWNNLVNNTGNPLIYVMLPIIEEMVASGWRKSAHYDALAYPDIHGALQMERNGELAAKLPNGNIKIKSAFVDMGGFSYDQAEELYKKFAVDYNIDTLKGVPPLDVLFLYHYANERKDPETMWHLLAEDKLKPSLKEYMKDWKQQPDIAEEARWIEIYEDALYRVKEKLYLDVMVNYRTENGLMPPSPVLVTKRDNIWLVRNQMYEAYSLEGKENEYENLIAILYKAFSVNQEDATLKSATPGEIGGLFLKAAEQKDYKTMYALMEEPAKSFSLESFRHQVSSRDIPDFSTIEKLTFTLDMYDHEDGQRRGRIGVMAFSSDTTFPSIHYDFFLVETAKGWRMEDMNVY